MIISLVNNHVGRYLYEFQVIKKLMQIQLNGGVNEGVVPSSNQSHRKENLSNSNRTFPAKNVQKQQYDSVYPGLF